MATYQFSRTGAALETLFDKIDNSGTAINADVGVESDNVPAVNQATTSTASAGTTVLESTTRHLVTGTTTITSFNGVAGVTYHCRADEAFEITHHATDLVVTQTAASIITGAGDTFDVYMVTSTTCRIENYQRSNGESLSSTQRMTLTAGEDLVNGDWCYLKSDGKMWKTDASAEATAAGMICVCTATIATDATGVFIKRDAYTTSGLTAGSAYYLSETAGAITDTKPTTSGAIVRTVSYALSTTVLIVDVDQTYIEV